MHSSKRNHINRVLLQRLRTCVLGAVNGVLYGLLVALMVWQLDAWADRHINAEDTYGNQVSAISLGSSVRWTGLVIIWVLAFTLAAGLVDHLWPYNKKRSVLFWEVVGVVAIAAWNAFVLFAAWMDKLQGQPLTLAMVTSPWKPLFGPIGLSTVPVTTGDWVQILDPVTGPMTFVIVIALNFFYGHLLRLFRRKITSDALPV